MPINKRVSFTTLGCRLNIAETGSLVEDFTKRGYEVVEFGQEGHITVINTCTVTDSADATCRNMIRKAKKFSPSAKIVVMGCYSQMESGEVSKIEGVDLILGTSKREKIFDYLDELDQKDSQIINVERSGDFWGAATTKSDSHTRSFLKIQDGCSYVCAYCIIPFARGGSRAISVEDGVNEAKRLIEDGFKEIVLTGVNIGEYEASSGEKLSELIKRVLDLDGLERLRLSSVEVNTINDELLKVLDHPKFMNQFHIPLQSGDDDILKAMRRKYDTAHYRDTVLKIKERFPGVAFGADVIVGFPGETEEQFENTFRFMESLPLTHFHVFPFSKRKGTTAFNLPNHIDGAVKKERVKKLIELGDRKLSAFAEGMVGSTNLVLFERRNKQGLFVGNSCNFLKVKVDTDLDLSNKIFEVKITSADKGTLLGELVS